MTQSKEKTSDKEDYMNAQLSMAKAFRTMNEIPLDWFIEILGSSLAFTPLIDPTLFMKKADDGERWLRIARAMKECRDKIKEEFSP